MATRFDEAGHYGGMLPDVMMVPNDEVPRYRHDIRNTYNNLWRDKPEVVHEIAIAENDFYSSDTHNDLAERVARRERRIITFRDRKGVIEKAQETYEEDRTNTFYKKLRILEEAGIEPPNDVIKQEAIADARILTGRVALNAKKKAGLPITESENDQASGFKHWKGRFLDTWSGWSGPGRGTLRQGRDSTEKDNELRQEAEDRRPDRLSRMNKEAWKGQAKKSAVLAGAGLAVGSVVGVFTGPLIAAGAGAAAAAYGSTRVARGLMGAKVNLEARSRERAKASVQAEERFLDQVRVITDSYNQGDTDFGSSDSSVMGANREVERNRRRFVVSAAAGAALAGAGGAIAAWAADEISDVVDIVDNDLPQPDEPDLLPPEATEDEPDLDIPIVPELPEDPELPESEVPPEVVPDEPEVIEPPLAEINTETFVDPGDGITHMIVKLGQEYGIEVDGATAYRVYEGLETQYRNSDIEWILDVQGVSNDLYEYQPPGADDSNFRISAPGSAEWNPEAAHYVLEHIADRPLEDLLEPDTTVHEPDPNTDPQRGSDSGSEYENEPPDSTQPNTSESDAAPNSGYTKESAQGGDIRFESLRAGDIDSTARYFEGGYYTSGNTLVASQESHQMPIEYWVYMQQLLERSLEDVDDGDGNQVLSA